MRANIARVMTGGALSILLIAPAFAAPGAKLSPSEIQATFFNGQPFTASTPSNVRFKMTFSADGKMKRVPIGPGSKGEGTWKLSKDGFCTAWKGAKDNCFTVVSAGENQWSVLRGSTIMATWSK
ncbi:MAG TPA: hypothetical protein VK442_05095 [Xanthobacteraceae bacterium]|nr:hypothetical protein [Xanthobacteraceae bacterium]